MYMSVHVCAQCTCPCTHTRKLGKNIGCLCLLLSALLPWDSLSLVQNLLSGARWPVSEISGSGSLFPQSRVTSTCDHVQLFMWVLGIQTQIFVLAEQVPLPLNPSSYAPYTLFFKTESLSEPRAHRLGKTSWASKSQGLSQLCLSGDGVVGMSCSAWLCLCVGPEYPNSGPHASVASALFYQLSHLPGPCCFPWEPTHLSGLWLD